MAWTRAFTRDPEAEIEAKSNTYLRLYAMSPSTLTHPLAKSLICCPLVRHAPLPGEVFIISNANKLFTTHSYATN